MINNFIINIPNKTKEYIIFDIGARDCIQSIEFYKHFPNAKIYAFECNPNTLDICKQNIENYKDRITLIEGAVCNYDGEIIFYPINQQQTITSWKDGNPGASSLFKSNGKYTIEHYVQDEIITNCHRLDSIMIKYNIPHVDIIWMDLQGAELLAMNGLGKYLQNTKYIYTEVSHKEIYNNQCMFTEFNDFMKINNFSIKNKISMLGWQEDALYINNNFDIVIPVGPNDIDIITKQLEYTKKNIIGYRNIYLISCIPNLTIDGCITINECIFPFSINTIADYHGKNNRNGWYLQQLLKLYAGLVIPNILDTYLVIDSDTFFLKPTQFIDNGKCLYNYGNEYNYPYFEHMQKLNKTLQKQFRDKSGICHHMMFETKYISELFELVETTNQDTFYNCFIKNVSNTQYLGSGASEYEIYFNYMIHTHPDKIIVRPLIFKNTSVLELNNTIYHYISYHHYMR